MGQWWFISCFVLNFAQFVNVNVMKQPYYVKRQSFVSLSNICREVSWIGLGLGLFRHRCCWYPQPHKLVSTCIGCLVCWKKETSFLHPHQLCCATIAEVTFMSLSNICREVSAIGFTRRGFFIDDIHKHINWHWLDYLLEKETCNCESTLLSHNCGSDGKEC